MDSSEHQEYIKELISLVETVRECDRNPSFNNRINKSRVWQNITRVIKAWIEGTSIKWITKAELNNQMERARRGLDVWKGGKE